jgi:hypothetical protein
VDYARECVRLATLVKEPEARERLLDLAREWMAVAMHEAKLPAYANLKPSAETVVVGEGSTTEIPHATRID